MQTLIVLIYLICKIVWGFTEQHLCIQQKTVWIVCCWNKKLVIFFQAAFCCFQQNPMGMQLTTIVSCLYGTWGYNALVSLLLIVIIFPELPYIMQNTQTSRRWHVCKSFIPSLLSPLFTTVQVSTTWFFMFWCWYRARSTYMFKTTLHKNKFPKTKLKGWGIDEVQSLEMLLSETPRVHQATMAILAGGIHRTIFQGSNFFIH